MEGPPQAKIQSETEPREASVAGAPEGREDQGKEEGWARPGLVSPAVLFYSKFFNWENNFKFTKSC